MKKRNFAMGMMRRVVGAALILTLTTALFACGGTKERKITEADIASDQDKCTYTAREGQADYTDTAILYEVNVRQYTKEGTFKAFEEHLERLRGMGINTLWFMPIYPIAEKERKGTLGSYYAIKDYTSTNSEFGTTEEFKALVDKAHDMGFKIILDWVANHTGWDHTWITEHPEYYMHDETGAIITPVGQDWKDVAQLDFENEEMRKAMISAMKFWVTDVGVDGFRCDYAQGVPADFWEQARKEISKEKPVMMLAEDGLSSNALLEYSFDCNYNFELYDLLKTVSIGGTKADDLQYKITTETPEGSFKMNFLDNHDKNTYDGTLEKRYGEQAIYPLTVLMYTVQGMPLIYSGQEETLDKSLEFFEKDDIEFGDYEYQELFTKLSKIKSKYSAFNNITGGKIELVDDDNRNVLAYKREGAGKNVVVVLNLSAEEQKVTYNEKLPAGAKVFLCDGEGNIGEEVNWSKSKTSETLKPWSAYILVYEKE